MAQVEGRKMDGGMKAGAILGNAVRMAGFDPSLMAVPENWRMLAEMAVNGGLERLAAERFPQMRRVEFRRYRPDWSAGAGWAKGMECWHGSRYWRLGADGAGDAEPAHGSAWRALEMGEVAAFIEFSQPWEPTEIEPGGVDVNDFAFAADPKYHPDAEAVRGCRMTEFGVTLPTPAPEGVYVKFIPQVRGVTYVEWSGEAQYAAGDVAYLTQTGECYLCAGGATRGVNPAADGAVWRPVRTCRAWQKYLTLLAAAEIQTAEQGRYQTQAAAEREFEALCERFLCGCGENEASMGGYA